MPGVLGAAIFVFAEMLGSFAAAFVLGIPARFFVITTAIWQAVTIVPARLRPRRGDRHRAVRGDVPELEPVPGHRPARQFRDDHRQGVPPAPHGDGTRWPGCCSRCACSTSSPRWCCRSASLLLTSFERFATVILSRGAVHAGQLRERRSASRAVTPRADQQPDPRRRRRHCRRRDHGGAGVDHLPLAGARAQR